MGSGVDAPGRLRTFPANGYIGVSWEAPGRHQACGSAVGPVASVKQGGGRNAQQHAGQREYRVPQDVDTNPSRDFGPQDFG